MDAIFKSAYKIYVVHFNYGEGDLVYIIIVKRCKISKIKRLWIELSHPTEESEHRRMISSLEKLLVHVVIFLIFVIFYMKSYS